MLIYSFAVRRRNALQIGRISRRFAAYSLPAEGKVRQNLAMRETTTPTGAGPSGVRLRASLPWPADSKQAVALQRDLASQVIDSGNVHSSLTWQRAPICTFAGQTEWGSPPS